MKLPRDIQSLRIARHDGDSAKSFSAGDGLGRDRRQINSVLAAMTERRSGGGWRFVGDELVSLVQLCDTTEISNEA